MPGFHEAALLPGLARGECVSGCRGYSAEQDSGVRNTNVRWQ
jgi:hypothetical protein